MKCPDKYEFCEVRKVGKGDYLYVKGEVADRQVEVKADPRPRPEKGFLVETRKTNAGVKLALVTRLKEYEKLGIGYDVVNDYLRKEFDDLNDTNPMGVGYIADALTYDPKNESPKTYSEIYATIRSFSANMNWMPLFDIIEGLKMN